VPNTATVAADTEAVEADMVAVMAVAEVLVADDMVAEDSEAEEADMVTDVKTCDGQNLFLYLSNNLFESYVMIETLHRIDCLLLNKVFALI
jgi:hypothetical protein